MELVKNLYLRAYLLVMTLYVFLNKGIAYTYLVEALWLFGILLLFINRKKVELIWNKTTKLVLFFIAISFIYILRGFTKYDLVDLIRDSFIFQYGWFVFILFLFKEKLEIIWGTLFFIYKWFPFVALLNFILQYFVPFFETVTPFGGIPILLYKNGEFHIQTTNKDDYIIVSCCKNAKKSRYEVTTKSNKKIKVLLRWKNGNGIAYPAFQIS